MRYWFLTLMIVVSVSAQADDLRIKEVDLVHFSHTDVGFTDHPIVCRELYRRYLDMALDTIEATAPEPEGERFVWTAESALAVREWWEASVPERRARFLSAVRSGRLEVTALACNNTPFMNGQQWQTMVHWLPEEVWNTARPQVAVQDDVNGFPRAGAKALLDRGIHRLFTGINEDSGGVPFPRPSAFWWKQPDGRRLFVWLNMGYGSGYDFFEAAEWRRGPVPRAADASYRPPRAGDFYRSDETSVRAAHKRCVEMLQGLERRGFKSEILTLSLTNQWRFDNDPPFPPISGFVAAWNRLGLKPTLRLCTVSDAMARMEAAMGPTAPEHAGDWTDWWANGTASAPRETAASRAAKRMIDDVQSPVWGPMNESATKTVEALLRDLCLFDEHTWGSSLSVAQPYSLDTIGQFTEKSILAYRPMARAEWLLSQRARTKLAGTGPGLFLANAAPASFSGWVTMAASCLRKPYRSLEDPRAGIRHALYFDKGIQPWGRPTRAEDLTREDLSATFPDNAPAQVVRFWVENLEPTAIRELQLSEKPCEDRAPDGAPAPRVETSSSGWPETVAWPGMTRPLFLSGFGDLNAVVVKGFAPRSLLADLRGAGQGREALRKKTLVEVAAEAAGPAEVVNSVHTIRYTQPLRHPRLAWGTRILEIWKRTPRARYTLRINRLSSGAPEIFYASFPLPTGGSLPRLTSGGMPFVPFTDQLPGTCRDYFAIDGSASYETSEGHWLWVSRDAPLIAFGASPTLAFRSSPPDDVNRLQAMLFNNFWYTNFVGDSHGVMEFQFDLAWSPPDRPFPPGAASTLESKPIVVINPDLPEDQVMNRRLFQP